MTNSHDPFQPLFEENTEIVRVDGQKTKVPVTVVFERVPSPGIVIKIDQLPRFIFAKGRFEIALGNGARLETMVRSFNPGTGRGLWFPLASRSMLSTNGFLSDRFNSAFSIIRNFSATK